MLPHVHRLYALLGLSKARLPDEGIPPRIINGVRVWVVPKATKAQFIRTFCECPHCGRTLTVKCLGQHVYMMHSNIKPTQKHY